MELEGVKHMMVCLVKGSHLMIWFCTLDHFFFLQIDIMLCRNTANIEMWCLQFNFVFNVVQQRKKKRKKLLHRNQLTRLRLRSQTRRWRRKVQTAVMHGCRNIKVYQISYKQWALGALFKSQSVSLRSTPTWADRGGKTPDSALRGVC